VGALVLPFILLFFLVSHLAPTGPCRATPAHGRRVRFSRYIELLAYAAFALSFVLSLIFLGEQWLLRSRHMGAVVWRLPPLELLERMSQSGGDCGVGEHRHLGRRLGLSGWIGCSGLCGISIQSTSLRCSYCAVRGVFVACEICDMAGSPRIEIVYFSISFW